MTVTPPDMSIINRCVINDNRWSEVVNPENETMPIPEGILEIWQRIVDSVAIYLSVPGVMINRIKPPELEVFLSNNGPESPFKSGTQMPMDGLYCTEVALSREMLQVNDAAGDTRWAGSPTARAGIMAYLGIPLHWPDGEVFGTLCAVDVSKKEWGEKAVNLLSTLKDVIESHMLLVMNMNETGTDPADLEQALNEVLTLHGFIHLTACTYD